MDSKEYQTRWNENKAIDLHNDLLSYLVASPSNTPHDSATCSSIEQLRKGGVGCLVLAVFAETKKGSELQLACQSKAYERLHEQYGDDFCLLQHRDPGKISTCLAIENCSTFSSESEPLDKGLRRLKRIFQKGIYPLYVSLTWNQENRFGGGAHSSAGLKDEGKIILDLLEGNATAIDLSHASDQLALDILNYMDRSNSSLHVIASHSEFRAITDASRNLPDEIAQEIAHRGGVIGLTAIRRFIGDTVDDFYRHIEHALAMNLGNALSIGADFFCVPGLPPKTLQAFYQEHFFPELSDASCLRPLLEQIGKRFGVEVKNKIAWKNAYDSLVSKAVSTTTHCS
jgi:membrane dipeptidase